MTDPEAAFGHLRSFLDRLVPFPDDVWEDVRLHWRQHKVRRGDTLTRQGDTERWFSLVLEGTQRVYFTTPDGRDVTVAFTYPYHPTGIPDSFFLQTPSAYVLEALTDGEMLSIDRAAMEMLLDRYGEMTKWALRLMAMAMAGRGKREREQMTMTAEERYERLLSEAPHIFQLVSQKHLASYLGMTPETLSRIRAGRS